MILEETILKLAQITQLEIKNNELKQLQKEMNEDLQNLNNDKILSLAWQMSTLARIDGIRFEPSIQNATSYENLCKTTRTNYFDFETKKNILLGAFVSIEENYENYLQKAWDESEKNFMDFTSLRKDEEKQSLTREEIMKKAPNANGEYFVVPQVVEE